jgi:uncharacterized glyoxalase superfamily protein PhnB
MTNANPVLAVPDAASSAVWYRDVFGCDTRDIDAGNWVFCRCGRVTFMLGSCPGEIPAHAIGDHSYVAYIDVDDVEAFYERAADAGATITKPLRSEPWGRREFAITSPDGHRFMIAQKLS